MSGRHSGGRQPAVQAALAELLGALGFRAMSLQVRQETDPEKLRLYAQIILTKAPSPHREAIREKLDILGLLTP